jgi:hypothetical protein
VCVCIPVTLSSIGSLTHKMNPESATPKKIDIIKKKDPVKMTRFFKHVAAPLKTGGSVPEESKVKPVAVALFHAEIKPVTDKQHVHWMLEKEKEYNSSNEGKHMTWCVVEQPMGKDLMIYTDGEMVQLWTPYHGFVDVSSTPFGDMKAIKDQLSIPRSKACTRTRTKLSFTLSCTGLISIRCLYSPIPLRA